MRILGNTIKGGIWVSYSWRSFGLPLGVEQIKSDYLDKYGHLNVLVILVGPFHFYICTPGKK